VTSKVELSGDFFKRDPGKTLRQNVRSMLDALAAEMERLVQDEIAGHAGAMPRYTGWSHLHTVGRTASYSGKRWGTWAVVSANTQGMSKADAKRTKAAAVTIEQRWHPYRKVKGAVYRSRALLRADLTEGLD
jgi:hypothetical protein